MENNLIFWNFFFFLHRIRAAKHFLVVDYCESQCAQIHHFMVFVFVLAFYYWNRCRHIIIIIRTSECECFRLRSVAMMVGYLDWVYGGCSVERWNGSTSSVRIGNGNRIGWTRIALADAGRFPSVASCHDNACEHMVRVSHKNVSRRNEICIIIIIIISIVHDRLLHLPLEI